MAIWWVVIGIFLALIVVIVLIVKYFNNKRKGKDYERSLKMIPLLIHLPPETSDIERGGRDERDITNEIISQATVMYSIIAGTIAKKSIKTRLYGQKAFSFEIVAKDGLIKYYAVVPAVLTETVRQAIQSSYPTARVEEEEIESIFADGSTASQIAGGELEMKKDVVYPIQTYEDMKWDGQTAILNAFSKVKDGEGMGLQVMFRPASDKWSHQSEQKVSDIKNGKSGILAKDIGGRTQNLFIDLIRSPFEPPEAHKYDDDKKELTQPKQEEISAIENKSKFPGFECLIRIVACSSSKVRSETLVGGIVAAFSQFDSPTFNGFKYNMLKNSDQLATDYIFHFFQVTNKKIILN